MWAFRLGREGVLDSGIDEGRGKARTEAFDDESLSVDEELGEVPVDALDAEPTWGVGF